MANPGWTSTSSVDWDTNGNWSTGTAPANGDSVFFNHVGTANCTTGGTEAGETYTDLSVEASYNGQIGTSGTPLAPDGVTNTYFRGGPNARLFLAGACVNVEIDTANQLDDAVTLTATAMALLNVVRGGCTVSGSGTTASNGRINVCGTGRLTLNGAAMSSGTNIYVRDSGLCRIYVNYINLQQLGGEVHIGTATTTTTATGTQLVVDGGTCHVYSSGTQTLVEVGSGGRIIAENDLVRAWSAVRVFGNRCLLDLSRTSVQNHTLTAGIIATGGATGANILGPTGGKITYT